MNLARYLVGRLANQQKKSIVTKTLMLQLIVLNVGIASAYSSEITALVVQSQINDQTTEQRLPFGKDQPLYNTHLIWKSSQGISCSVALVQGTSRKGEGTIECITKSGYKAQTDFNCLVNRNIESGAYLFFGRVGVTGENKNFTLWCE